MNTDKKMAVDFHYYSINVVSGQENQDLAGFVVTDRTYKVHRHRREDLLAILMTFSERTPQFIESLAEEIKNIPPIFFDSAGSVTRAIQAVAEALNAYLLEWNVQAEEIQQPMYAALNIGVLHRGYLFLGQGGDAHTLIIRNGVVEKISNAKSDNNPLGLARESLLQFQQTKIEGGEILILCNTPPEIWDGGVLAELEGIDFRETKQKLLDRVNTLQAVVIHCKEGTGLVEQQEFAVEKKEVEDEIEPEKELAFEEEQEPEFEDAVDDKINESNQSEYQGTDEIIPAPAESTIEDIWQDEEDILVQPGITEEPEKEVDASPVAKGYWAEKTMYSFAALWQKSRNLVGGLTKRDEYSEVAQQRKKIPSRGSTTPLMSLLAFILPGVLIALSLMVYINSGRREQMIHNLEQAQEYANLATATDDKSLQRSNWQQANTLANTALQFGKSDAAEALLKQSQYILDEMDLATRLNFRPALTDFFPQGSLITKIRSTPSGVFLLESNSGKILRIYLNNKGFYETDTGFQCGPGEYALVSMGNIIDLLVLPSNSRDYEILAIDDKGTLLYCKTGTAPIASSLIPPSEDWGRIVAFALDDYKLFVADAENDAIWMYKGRDFEIKEMAGVVFDKQTMVYMEAGKIDLGGMINLAASQDDVFILHQDSHMTICQYNAYREITTACQDPVPYSDDRVGLIKNPLVYMDAQFIGMQDLRFPNGSLYILDAANSTIMRFSFQLNLERTYKPQTSRTYPLPQISPTGFGISADRNVFLAFANQLFLSELP